MSLNENEIYDLYVNKGLKILEIAKLLHIKKKIFHRLKIII